MGSNDYLGISPMGEFCLGVLGLLNGKKSCFFAVVS